MLPVAQGGRAPWCHHAQLGVVVEGLRPGKWTEASLQGYFLVDHG